VFESYFSLLATSAFGAEAVVSPTGEDGQRFNEQAVLIRQGSDTKTVSARKNVAVFAGDNVIPHMVDGGSWSSAVTLTNLDTRTLQVTVFFFRDDGSDLALPVVGQGMVRGMRITLTPSSSYTFSTTGGSSGTASGWAYIMKENVNDAVSGMCIFRQRTAGRPDYEAAVPIVSEFDNRAVLLYDNTNSFVTAAAFANPNSASARVTFTVRNENGDVLELKTLTLPGLTHTAGTIPATFSSTAGRRGSIEFITSGTYGIGVVGLRFNPTGAFTSFNVLSNINWLLN
jgi:hypothetical protein